MERLNFLAENEVDLEQARLQGTAIIGNLPT